MHRRTKLYMVSASFALSAMGAAEPLHGGVPSPLAATASVLSSRPDMVSDGSALIRIDIPEAEAGSRPKITLGKVDVTDEFKAAPDGSWLGVVSGLQLGANAIATTVNGSASRLIVVNHDRNGPIISGPHQQPWICETSLFTLPDGSTLGPAQDADCDAPAKVMYLYMSTITSTFKPLPPTSVLPADVEKTMTSDGRVVNYIVRLETGVVNRGIYQFAVLYDPANEPAPSPTTIYRAWNRKVIFTFGGSIMAGYAQGLTTGGVLNDLMLSQGFAVISSSLNVFGNDANDVVSAESASMTRERFEKEFGPPIYVMGWGSSGGSMQQYLIANNYPGILDGIIPGSSFSDLHSILSGVVDCSLMSRAFVSTQQTWTDAQKAAVSGYQDYRTCSGFNQQPPTALEPTFSPSAIMAKQVRRTAMGQDISNCHIEVPVSVIYDPKTNPKGARCSLYDNIVTEAGIDPETGYAARPLDNVGVQYGLKAFQSGAISADQFIALNEKIEGYDGDGNFQAARSVASRVALNNYYAYGRINEMRNLGDIPIIDVRNYWALDAHNAVSSMTARARLIRSNGSASNQIILRGAPRQTDIAAIAIRAMDEWLSNIAADKKSYSSAHEKVMADKPADLTDACYTSRGDKIAEPADLDNRGRCGSLYPYFGSPRLAAGAPITNDILKCQLKPVQRSDYPEMSDPQFARLERAFSSGVCDYSKPGVGYGPLVGPWLTYAAPGVAAPLSPKSTSLAP